MTASHMLLQAMMERSSQKRRILTKEGFAAMPFEAGDLKYLANFVAAKDPAIAEKIIPPITVNAINGTAPQ